MSFWQRIFGKKDKLRSKHNCVAKYCPACHQDHCSCVTCEQAASPEISRRSPSSVKFGKGATPSSQPTASAPTPAPSITKGVVTDCRIWKCPKCGELLEKRGLGGIWIPFEPISKVAGTGTCTTCGTAYEQSDIYGGRFDVHTVAPVAKSRESPPLITLLVFRLRSFDPPSDPKAYCKQVLATRFPRARLQRHFVAGNAGDLTVNEAVALYQDFTKKGQLEDLGKLFDSFAGSGPLGDRIVALFFT